MNASVKKLIRDYNCLKEKKTLSDIEQETFRCLEHIMNDIGEASIKNIRKSKNNNTYFYKYLEQRKKDNIEFEINMNGKRQEINRNNYLFYLNEGYKKEEIFRTYNLLFGEKIDFYNANYQSFLDELIENSSHEVISNRYKKIGIKEIEVTNIVKYIKERYTPYYFDYIYKLIGNKQIKEIDLYGNKLHKINQYKYTINQAVDILKQVTMSIDPKFEKMLTTLISMNRIIFKINKGSYTLKHSYYPYVVVHWNGNLQSLLSFAHELGHAIYDKIFNIRSLGSPYTILNSETLARVFEKKVLDYLASNHCISLSDYEKIEMSKLYGSCIRQLIIHDFELMSIRNKGEINFSKTYLNIKKDYLNQFIAVDDVTATQWARYKHVYAPLYSISYPYSFLLSNVIVEKNIDISNIFKNKNIYDKIYNNL